MLRLVYLAGVLALAVFYYYFFGAGPTPSEYVEDLEWWRPWGTFMHWPTVMNLAQMARAGFPQAAWPIALGWLPPLLVAAGGWRLMRTPLARVCLVVLTALMMMFVYYGLRAEQVWRFLEWRFVAVAASFCAIVTAILFAASLFDGVLRRSRALAALVALAVVAAILLLSTGVTGTNSRIQFNISPWPVVTLFGFLLLGATIAALHAAVGAGTWLRARLTGWLGVIVGLAAAAVVAGAAGTLIFSARGGGIPVALAAVLLAAIGFALPEASPETRSERRGVILALIGAVATAAVATWRAGMSPLVIVASAELLALLVALVFAFLNRRPAATTRAGALRFWVGAGLLLAILGSAQVAASMQRRARDVTALTVLDALEAYKKDKATYPDSLDDLVPKYLAEIPRPGIGLLRDEDDHFSYSNYGDSYALEFASVLWVQCQYSPPYEFAASDPNEAAEDQAEEQDSPYETPKSEKTPPVSAPKEQSEDDVALKATLAKHGLNGSWTCPKEPPKLW